MKNSRHRRGRYEWLAADGNNELYYRWQIRQMHAMSSCCRAPAHRHRLYLIVVTSLMAKTRISPLRLVNKRGCYHGMARRHRPILEERLRRGNLRGACALSLLPKLCILGGGSHMATGNINAGPMALNFRHCIYFRGRKRIMCPASP